MRRAAWCTIATTSPRHATPELALSSPSSAGWINTASPGTLRAACSSSSLLDTRCTALLANPPSTVGVRVRAAFTIAGRGTSAPD